MNRSLTAALSLLAALAPAAQAQDRGLPRGERVDRVPARDGMSFRASPSAVISAEIALSQLARKKGQWKAMRDTAAPEAVMFRPEPVNAQAWLKRQGGKPVATKWDPQAAWMSCDGSIGVVQGTWSQGEADGHFASVWRRHEKGGYKWLLRLKGVEQSAATVPPDMLSAIVADCAPRKKRPRTQPPDPKRKKEKVEPPPINALIDFSVDKTLYWRSVTNASGARRLLVRIRKDGTMQVVLGAEFEEQAEEDG
ncbi:MAG: hypothetical protein P8J20_09045 [Novosphingobium sp.]|nr:hypothetical protein [Novosphingobium sp.]